MKGKTLKYILFLATISIAGILIVQFAFIRSSYNISEKQFRESTSVALKEVAWQVLLASGNTANFDSIAPVKIVSGNYYLVNIDVAVDKNLLMTHLVEQLKRHDIHDDFEFAIYNPESEQMEERTLVLAGQEEKVSSFDFPLDQDCTNYFGIHFPNRSSYFNSHLSIWYFFSGLLIIVILFFVYTLSVIIRQRQLSEVQKNFINNLTHELKTPISSIALSASVLTDEQILKTPKRLFNYARIIEDQNKRLSKNVEKVLDLATLEKNRIILNLKLVDLKQILEDTIEKFGQTDFGQKSEVRIRPNNFNVKILADKFHFTNLISNILENAAKYCTKNPFILVEFVESNKYFQLNFIDNGIGISKDQRKKIFKKFYRVPTGNVHNVKGFGLGLDYVQKITVAHKWKINVDENPKGGSIFTLTIPKRK